MRDVLYSIAICVVAVALVGGLGGCQQLTEEDPMQTFVTGHVAKIRYL